MDGAGNVYIADSGNHRIRRVDAAGVITTVAGTGGFGFSGDGGPATAALLNVPTGLAVDGAGNVYIADSGNHRIRRVNGAGNITTVAGTGATGSSGDGGPATAAQLGYPTGVAVDGAGNVYIADYGNHRIRRVDGAGGITTVAGTGAFGFSGDGGPATAAQLYMPAGVTVDRAGNVYIADAYNHRVRRVDTAAVITTVAGTGAAGFSGDGGPATAAQLRNPFHVTVDGAGNVYLADNGNHRIRRVDAAGVITTVAGTGAAGFSGDGGLASAAQLDVPTGIAVDGVGNVYIADSGNHRIRRVDAAGVITTVAGTAVAGFGGDGGPATAAQLSNPSGVAVDGAGNVYIAATGNHRIRRVDAAGVITTVAGTSASGFSGDGGPATAAQLSNPSGMDVDGAGNVYVADAGNFRIRRVDAAGVITTVAGTSAFFGSNGDGGPATAAQLAIPRGVGVDGAGNVYIADSGNHRIRRVDAAGVITTMAGQIDVEGVGTLAQATLAGPVALHLASPFTLVAGGAFGVVQAIRAGGDQLETVAGRYPHGAATGSLARYRPDTFGTVEGVAFDVTASVIYLTETSASRLHVITVVDPDDPATWTITALGAGTPGFSDGALATARFRQPSGLLLDGRTLYVADSGNHVIRAIDLDGQTVTTVAGTPATLGYFGDDLLATAALMYAPTAMTLAANGDLFIADSGNHRVRRVEAGTGIITTVLGDGVAASSGEGAPAWTFPVDDPRGLTTDALGNLYVTSTTTVRLLAADDDGIVDGNGAVQTIYGAAPRATFPAYATSCLTGIAVVDAETVRTTDRCSGLYVELSRQAVAP